MQTHGQHPSARLRLTALVPALLVLTTLGVGRFTPFPGGLTTALAQSTGTCSVASATATPSAATSAADPRYVQITFTNQCGAAVPLSVNLAADDEREQQGLMGVTSLPEDEGELFIFDNLAGGNEVHVSFWMEDTPIPLSVAFVGKDETVHEIQDMAPESRDLHTPQLPYLYAVEANEGWFADHDIAAGAKVNLTPALTLIAAPASP